MDAAPVLRVPAMCAVIERILRSADFERVLRAASQTRSAHFAIHHLGETPSRPGRLVRPETTDLSTGQVTGVVQPVDEVPAHTPRPVQNAVPRPAPAAPERVWLGAVVPKRHARRAVTRSLLKRQIRAAVSGQQDSLAKGLWVVRLRAPFDKKLFPSAASAALQLAARGELEQLLVRAAQRDGAR
jgi:ribonuclease P protein component